MIEYIFWSLYLSWNFDIVKMISDELIDQTVFAPNDVVIRCNQLPNNRLRY